MLKMFCFLILFHTIPVAWGHHYKGLPHYSYFENYPQVPTLEFVGVHNGYEIFVTVYNFQGLDLENVQDSDIVRLYAFIYNIKSEKIYKGLARFDILSRGEIVHKTDWEEPEQENIFAIQKKILNQDNLELLSYLKNENNVEVEIRLPFQITKSPWQKYGLYISIAGFFLVVALIKTIARKRES